jgi:protein involved in polysaccharide export with SLBB domain
MLVTAAAAFAVSAMAVTIDVKGAVAKPGAIEWKQGMKVRHAIDAAGGFTDNADPMAVSIVEADGRKVTVDLSKVGPSASVPAGARIEVPTFDPNRYVMIAGAVAKPGAVPYREGITVGDALNSAQPFDVLTSDTVRIVGKDGVRGLPKGVSQADLYAMTLAPGEAVKVNYPGQSFSNRELLIAIAIIVLILLLK